ncbi:hypothetical protein K435DRAFT_803753 [Dendrothele bispora CBS 962.96]|uniref:Uncharacterized protein n=1 Tax=Dendrothele bispora (strain CBS 962.96) TaxID=1314807 RepID=A0A4S8LH85_DENBC|nr:hypothetical protein K435DRAFT_803753 [Dendrothele bispora CBS 962.96]
MEGCICVSVPKKDIKEGEQGLNMIELWREQEDKKSESPSPDSTLDSPSSSTSSDVDYDSDNESTTSSSYSAVSKFSSHSSESMTSVSTTCSDVTNDDSDDKNENKNNDRVFYRCPGAVTTITSTVVATAPVAISCQGAPRPTASKTTFAPRNNFKAESHKPQSTPTTLRTLAPKSRYMYKGGETGVVTGGVMLGSSPSATTTTTTLHSSSSGSSKGTKEGSWRASSGLSKGTKKNASAVVSENWRRRV